jgi:thiol-disulfide isomerase/thioredoxin
MALFTWAFVVLILVIVIVLLVVKISRASAPTPTATSVATAPAAVVHAAVTVPELAFDTVGAPAAAGPDPTVLTGQPPLTLHRRPAVVYVGAEFCPYCAAERWALVVALGRFGTFSQLGATVSSSNQVFAELPSFSFLGSAYRSRDISFSATEEYGAALATTAPAGFPPLQTPPALARDLMRRYGSDPASGSGAGVGAGATLPFVDIGNRVLIEGAAIGFSPGTLQGLSMAQVAADLSDPTTPVAEAVLGAANEITAAVCTTTGGKPGSVCSSPGVRAGALRLGL